MAASAATPPRRVVARVSPRPARTPAAAKVSAQVDVFASALGHCGCHARDGLHLPSLPPQSQQNSVARPARASARLTVPKRVAGTVRPGATPAAAQRRNATPPRKSVPRKTDSYVGRNYGSPVASAAGTPPASPGKPKRVVARRAVSTSSASSAQSSPNKRAVPKVRVKASPRSATPTRDATSGASPATRVQGVRVKSPRQSVGKPLNNPPALPRKSPRGVKGGMKEPPRLPAKKGSEEASVPRRRSVAARAVLRSNREAVAQHPDTAAADSLPSPWPQDRALLAEVFIKGQHGFGLNISSSFQLTTTPPAQAHAQGAYIVSVDGVQHARRDKLLSQLRDVADGTAVTLELVREPLHMDAGAMRAKYKRSTLLGKVGCGGKPPSSWHERKQKRHIKSRSFELLKASKRDSRTKLSAVSAFANVGNGGS